MADPDVKAMFSIIHDAEILMNTSAALGESCTDRNTTTATIALSLAIFIREFIYLLDRAAEDNDPRDLVAAITFLTTLTKGDRS